MEMNYEAKFKSVQDAMLPQTLRNARIPKAKRKQLSTFKLIVKSEAIEKYGRND